MFSCGARWSKGSRSAYVGNAPLDMPLQSTAARVARAVLRSA